MARPGFDRDYEGNQDDLRDPWGRLPGDPNYGRGPGDMDPLGGTPFGDPINATLPGEEAPPPAAPPPPGGSGPGFDLGPLLQGYGGRFTAPEYGQAFRSLKDLLGPAPSFNAPTLPTIQPFDYAPFSYAEYTPTTAEDVYSDPSFGLRKGIGEQALVNNKAALGLGRSAGTLKALLDYNQNFASQEYGNVDARRARDYGTNRANAFENYGTNRANAFQNWSANKDTSLGLYDRGFEAERARIEPQLYAWKTMGDLGTSAENRARDNAYQQFLNDYSMWHDNQNDIFNRLKWASEFGAGVSA